VSAVALPTPSTRQRAARRADRALTAVLVALGIALALGLGLRALGLTALVDYTDSMRPAIGAGDVVLDDTVAARDLRPGQIASIADPGAGGRLVTHRVTMVTAAGGRVTIVTRGDANDASERWVLPADASVKRMVARVPWIGHVMVWLSWPWLRGIVMALGAIAVLFFGLRYARRGG
jgi:signal peptidase I